MAGAFQRRGLIDEYIFSVMPVILGKGIPLFGDGGVAESLLLTESKTFPDGVVQVRYSPARAL